MSTRKNKKEYGKPIAPLYAFVYNARIVSVAVFLLLVGFVLQPVQQAFAAEEDVAQENIIVDDPIQFEDSLNISESQDTLTEPTIETENDGVPAETTEDVTEDQISESLINQENISDDTFVDLATSSEVIIEVGDEVVLDDFFNKDITDVDLVVDDVATDTDILVSDLIATNTASVVDEQSTSTTEASYEEKFDEVIDGALSEQEPVVVSEVVTENPPITKNDNLYTFDKSECVSVGNGTYHCSTDTGVIKNAGEQVFSSKGENGNFEIFMQTSNGLEQVTNNYYEDLSPKYDAKSERLVWQRLIDGRYQIVVYDLRDKEETILTSGSNNNMEPAISGESIVWQYWDGADWEIMLSQNSKIKQITDNDVQDIGPVVEDKFVVWTAVGEDTQLAQVYSLETGVIKDIADNEGGEIKNPRFILVYDTKFDNGDVITRGFDPETGLSTSLAATPAAPVPIEIPATDSTGETRALIQNKSASREDFSELGDIESGDNATSTDVNNSENELIIASVNDEIATTSPLVLSEYDLIVMPYENIATSTQLVDGDTN